jgi:hypothetical protein
MWSEWIERVKAAVQKGLEVTFGVKDKDYLGPKLKSKELNLTDDNIQLLETSSQCHEITPPHHVELIFIQANILLNHGHPQGSVTLKFQIIEEATVLLKVLKRLNGDGGSQMTAIHERLHKEEDRNAVSLEDSLKKVKESNPCPQHWTLTTGTAI